MFLVKMGTHLQVYIYLGFNVLVPLNATTVTLETILISYDMMYTVHNIICIAYRMIEPAITACVTNEYGNDMATEQYCNMCVRM